MDLLLTGGLVFDGTGSPGLVRDVAVVEGRIRLDPTPEESAATPPSARRDVSGRVVCPGIVDIHTHSDLTLLSHPAGSSKLRQGVTTEVVGNCGLGLAPLLPADQAAVSTDAIRSAVGYLDLDPSVEVSWQSFPEYLKALESVRPTMNVAALVPHLPVHAGVVGLDDDKATAAQLSRIVDLVETACDAGAVGISTGLVYAPLCFVAEDELMELGRVAARRGLLFAWHVRDYGNELMPSVQQAIRVASATGCRLQISHLTAVGRRNWGAVDHALAAVDVARRDGLDVGVDIYPYLAGNAPLSQLLPDWAQQGGSEVFAPRLADPEVRQRIRAAWQDRADDWGDIVVNALAGEFADADPPGLIGSTITALADSRGIPPDDVALDLLQAYGASVLMVAYGRSADDLATVLAHPATVIASDGQALDPDGATGIGRPHPRSYGCFPRYLAHHTDDLADGIRRCTSAAADRVGLTDRGRLIDGAPADLLVFDPSGLTDTATFADPHRFPQGVELVTVGGAVVVQDGSMTRARPGRVLRHPAVQTHSSIRP